MEGKVIAVLLAACLVLLIGNIAVFGPGFAQVEATDSVAGSAANAETTSITYNANGGTGADVTTAPLSVNKVTSALGKAEASSHFAREGYTIVGWSLTKGSAKVDVPFDKRIYADNSGGGNVLYAVWAKDAAA